MYPIKRAAAKIPLHSSKQIFEAAGASGEPWMVQMDGIVDGWWMATLFQQGCDISKAEVEPCF
ncbi:unnamed protein product, partial [Staurois parvus]